MTGTAFGRQHRMSFGPHTNRVRPIAGKLPPHLHRFNRSHYPMKNTFPKLHNAMWPGLVGKEPGTDHPPISLDRMLELTANAEVNGQKFEGVDLFLFHPHTDPDASDDESAPMADKIAAQGPRRRLARRAGLAGHRRRLRDGQRRGPRELRRAP